MDYALRYPSLEVAIQTKLENVSKEILYSHKVLCKTTAHNEMNGSLKSHEGNVNKQLVKLLK